MPLKSQAHTNEQEEETMRRQRKRDFVDVARGTSTQLVTSTLRKGQGGNA